MQPFTSDMKSLLARRIEQASPAELMLFAGTLAAVEQTPAPKAAAMLEPASKRFEILDDDLVKDHETGLTWLRGYVPGGKRPWKESIAAAAAFELRGMKFRAPTIRERLSINDYERHNPAINTEVFNSDRSGWEWTSTLDHESPASFAWGVHFLSGYSYRGYHGHEGFVRAVRVGQF